MQCAMRSTCYSPRWDGPASHSFLHFVS